MRRQRRTYVGHFFGIERDPVEPRHLTRPRWWCQLRRHWRTAGFFTGGSERLTIDGRCGYCGAAV